MSGPIRQLAVDPSMDAARSVNRPGHEFQELWFALVRRHWTSVVLVPADAGGSAGVIARSIAEVGRRLRDGAVTAIVEDSLDYASAARIAAIVASTRQEGSAPSEVIVAVQPVVVEPLGVAVAQAADAVILCVEMGRTRLAAARRTIELIGRERIGGCFLIS